MLPSAVFALTIDIVGKLLPFIEADDRQPDDIALGSTKERRYLLVYGKVIIGNKLNNNGL